MEDVTVPTSPVLLTSVKASPAHSWGNLTLLSISPDPDALTAMALSETGVGLALQHPHPKMGDFKYNLIQITKK